MFTFLSRKRRHEELPLEIYASLVDWLYDGSLPLLAGGAATSLGMLLTAWKTQYGPLWICTAAFSLITVLRAIDMSAYKRRQSTHSHEKSPPPREATLSLELRYAIATGVHHAILGIWAFISIALVSDPAVHTIVATVLVAYAASGAGRNCGRPYIVMMQFLVAIGPFALGLLWTGDPYYLGLAVLNLAFFLAVMRLSLNLYGTILTSLNATREVSQLAGQFDTALNNMPHGLCMFDSEGRLLVGNDRASQLLGLPRELAQKDMTLWEMLYECVRSELISEYTAERVALQFETHQSDRNTGNIIIDTLDGRNFSLTFQPMENGGSVVLIEDITERKNTEAKISHMARYDALTGLPNRTYFRDQIDKALGPTRHAGKSCAVLFIDLDQFKQVNDTLGHPCGDQLLCAVADRLRKIVRDTDVVARFGGDEFVVFQSPVKHPKEAASLAKNIVKWLEEPYDIEGHHVVIGASIGIAVTPHEAISADHLLKNADMALYRAKADGRGTWRFFEPDMAAQAQARRSLELDLRAALNNNAFKVFYQPLVNLKTRRVSTCEALLRWPHPERGMIPPAEFIPIAEEMGLIQDIGRWVLKQACVEATQWPKGVRVAVNLSPIQFRRGDVVADVRDALELSGLAPNRLEVEITESVLLQDTPSTRAALHQLRELGVRISLDDFGTGYSSLSYLHSFPLQKVKIDRSFLEGLGSSDRPVTLLHGVARLSAELGMSVVVEGIETEEQLALVSAEEGIEEAQGYLFSPPIPGRQVRKLLQATSADIRQVA
ncbi:MAG TPA: EAL domain-containing protein [Xanthobacteraceae bacterium]|nr:EAL domain-containing protein [Xanthobacteraceae bacterium]